MQGAISKKYVKSLAPVSPKQYILKPEERKAVLEYVQNEAKKWANRRNKTNELMVLLLDRGLSSGELLGLDIGDLSCLDGRSTIIVHNSWDGSPREVYLDDSLETKINEYVQKYRQSAKPNEPLFISRYGNRTDLTSLYVKLNGRKHKPGQSRHIGIGPRLGIKKISPAMFRRTAIYQLAGFKNKERKRPMRLKSKVVGVTLTEFLRKYPVKKLSDIDVDFFKNKLQKANSRGLIKLPKHIEPWKNGTPKRYREIKLILCWPEYRNVLISLPLVRRRGRI